MAAKSINILVSSYTPLFCAANRSSIVGTSIVNTEALSLLSKLIVLLGYILANSSPYCC